MPPSAQLRLVVSRAEPLAPAEARLDPALSFRPAPPVAETVATGKLLAAGAAASLAIHAALLAWMMMGPFSDAARSAGEADDLIFLEGIPVELVMSMPAPENPPAEEAPEAEETPDEAPPELVEEVIEPTPEEPPPEDVPPEPEPEEVEPPPEPEPEQPAPPPEPVPEPEPEPEVTPEPVDATLPTAEAETGELPARPDEPLPVEEPSPPEEQPPEDQPPPEEPATEVGAVPTPRARPEPPKIAQELPKPPEPKREQPAPRKPAPPPPSAPAAPSAAAQSGGAGGGGASQAAGKAAESAYRAKVAARVMSKRFYPSAANRDRLTGRATVRFSLNASGRVTSVSVTRSAGSRILDDAAIEIVRRGAPYPPIPKGMGSAITVQVPISFDRPRR